MTTNTEKLTLERRCSACGVVHSLLILDTGEKKPVLKCLACYVRRNPDMEVKLQTWLDNHKKFMGVGGGGVTP
jgi:hypothetical protein